MTEFDSLIQKLNLPKSIPLTENQAFALTEKTVGYFNSALEKIKSNPFQLIKNGIRNGYLFADGSFDPRKSWVSMSNPFTGNRLGLSLLNDQSVNLTLGQYAIKKEQNLPFAGVYDHYTFSGIYDGRKFISPPIPLREIKKRVVLKTSSSGEAIGAELLAKGHGYTFNLPVFGIDPSNEYYYNPIFSSGLLDTIVSLGKTIAPLVEM